MRAMGCRQIQRSARTGPFDRITCFGPLKARHFGKAFRTELAQSAMGSFRVVMLPPIVLTRSNPWPPTYTGEPVCGQHTAPFPAAA